MARKMWLRKLVTGIAALLFACYQLLGSMNFPHGTWGDGLHYSWTEQGIRATWLELQPFTQVEGDVGEKQLHADTNRARKNVETPLPKREAAFVLLQKL